ncbi:acetate kinase [Aureimonas sp. SA4125]|uniref:acetate/propionate family kinase n=1 Tax=Aureimonas sp. SA4125 TaxID=2826993 RepID=UPI001CC58512|nr:acetate/propionate family kinase [Aureimonas sp. SA4125]BDA85363.1 acetate kinase [Aureimonas sp. SA4125]
MTDATPPAGGLTLAINRGSSSVKFALFADAAAPALARGTLDDKTTPGFEASDAVGNLLVHRELAHGVPASEVFAALLGWIGDFLGERRLAAVGHRIVHGGHDFFEPAVLTAARMEALEALTPLAPLHQPRCLAPVRVIAELAPDLVQVGCFDTAFHRSIDATVRRYALPRRFEEKEGIRKYGFHGLSYEHIADRLETMRRDTGSPTVVAHLGSGASLCAMKDGRSHDTSMGFSVLDGLPMATRCGAIDPGAILYLQRHMGLSAAEVEDILYHEAGLLGVSGITGNMRDLLASSDPHAAESVDLFTFHVAREVAVMANTLGGIERLVFTGGIGEHQAPIRAAICARLAWLGVVIDPEVNDRGGPCISAGGSRVGVLVIPADEERVIARHVQSVLRG